MSTDLYRFVESHVKERMTLLLLKQVIIGNDILLGTIYIDSIPMSDVQSKSRITLVVHLTLIFPFLFCAAALTCLCSCFSTQTYVEVEI
jgi:hypothetical protein